MPPSGRSGVSEPPGTMWLTGFIIFASGWTLFTWSSFENPFFEKHVRIQTDEGHFVIDRDFIPWFAIPDT